MSIIVKGMEMPKNCTRCDYIGLNAAIGCSVMSGTNGRATDCPLVALPEKHGRLVDADAIVNAMNNMNVGGEVFVTAVEYVKLIMNDADTIVEAEDSE